MTKDSMHGDTKDAAERLKKTKGENVTSPPGADVPERNPWERPGDRMMAAQAAVVNERRDALVRLQLEDVHAENVRPLQAVGEPVDRHEAAIAADRLAARAASDVPVPTTDAPAKKKARGKDGAVEERPTPEYELPEFEATRAELEDPE